MNKYVVIDCCGDPRIVEADTLGEAVEEVDWKYPGTAVSATLLPSSED